jgi:hypothetical protein
MTYPSALESRLKAIEGELDRLKSQNRRMEARLDQVNNDRGPNSTSFNSPSVDAESTESMAREAFDL